MLSFGIVFNVIFLLSFTYLICVSQIKHFINFGFQSEFVVLFEFKAMGTVHLTTESIFL